MTFRVLPMEGQILAISRAIKGAPLSTPSEVLAVGPPDTMKDHKERIEAFRARAAEGSKPRQVDDNFFIESYSLSARFNVEASHPIERWPIFQGEHELRFTGECKFTFSDTHPAYDGDQSLQPHYPGWQDHEPPPLTLFVHYHIPRPTISYLKFWPRRLADSDSNANIGSSSNTDTRVQSKYRYTLWNGHWQHRIALDEGELTKDRDVHICPGALRSLIWTAAAGETSAHPVIEDILSLAPIDENRPPIDSEDPQQVVEVWPEHQRRLESLKHIGKGRDELLARVVIRSDKLNWALDQGTKSIAWDETIGRYAQ
jgi:hypothetical protein